ncbi:MAG: hypothetical protein JNJ90_15075 [Saprospiraceae bacterium]|jgi:hypothetical protein|nr:hypothetical protein [Saprospiraceae bacterium]
MNQIPPDCLRPAFTERVSRLLAEGRPVNVYGKEGHGLVHLVDDLKRYCPEPVQFVRLSMRSYAGSYDGFLMALCDALHIPTGAEKPDFRSTINRFLEQPGNRLWLCLEHFDRLADEQVDNKAVDVQGYDSHFLNYLNSLNNNPNVSLLLTSEHEIATRELYVGGKRVRGSQLDIARRYPLERLTLAEIEAHLQRCMPTSEATSAFFQNQPTFFTSLVTEIDAHPAPLFFLEHIASKIPTGLDTPLERYHELMQFWKEDYDANHAKSTDLLIHDAELKVRRWLDRTKRVLGISKILRAINTKAGMTIAIIGSILYGLYQWGQQAWDWVSALFTK